MGLKDVAEDYQKQESSSSSSSSSGSYPKSELRVPSLAIYEDMDGELVTGFNDEQAAIEYRKESSEDTWSRHMVPSHIERFWMDRNDVRYIASNVEKVMGEDLFELLEEDAEAALKAIIHSAKHKSPSTTNTKVVDCAVCGHEIHLVHDKYEEISNRRVCTSHNVEELSRAGLL